MIREPYDNLLNHYYQTLTHLKQAQSYVKDIDVLNACLEDFLPSHAVKLLKPLVYKYRTDVNKIGQHQTGIHTLGDTRVYAQKTEQDLMFDVMYMVRCIVVIAVVKTGLERSLFEVLKKIRQDGCNITAWNLYD